MSESKTKITLFTHDKVFFLGTRLFNPMLGQLPVIRSKAGFRTRVVPEITMHAPIDKLLKKLVEKKFLRWNENGTYLNGTAVRALVNWDHADIISYYNSTIKGILNYYSFATNYYDFGMIVRLMRLSCARTLALKYKTRTASSVFKKYGKNLVDPEKEVGLNLPTTFHYTGTFHVG